MLKTIIKNFKLFDRNERYLKKGFSQTRKNIKNLIKIFICNNKIYVYIYFPIYNLRYTLKIKSISNRSKKYLIVSQKLYHKISLLIFLLELFNIFFISNEMRFNI